MKKRTPKEWQRLVAEYERGFESRGDFGERYGLATSTPDCKPQTDSMPSSKLAKACVYVLGQWPKRTRVFDYGEVELDTHWAEPKRSRDGQPIGCPKGEAKPSQNSVRPLLLGRKNCLRPCRVRLRRNRCPRSRGRALDARRQLGGRPTRRRHRQRHRIRKTPWDQSQRAPRRRPPTPGQRHHLSGSCPDSSRLAALPLRSPSRQVLALPLHPPLRLPPGTDHSLPTSDLRPRSSRQHGLVRRLLKKHLGANPKLAETAQSEDELRQAVAFPAARGPICGS